MKNIITAFCLTLTLSACNTTDNQANTTQVTNTSTQAQIHLPKNIIMVVGDGMGPAYTTAYRYYNDDPNTPAIEETVFDRHLLGMSSTYPARVSGYVTDLSLIHI